MREPPTSVPLQWLQTKLPLSELETQLREIGFPMKDATDEGKLFLSGVKSCDEVWFYKSPPETWQWKAGRAGYAIVPNGVVVDAILTVMN